MTGCATQTFKIQDGSGTENSGRSTFFISGLGQEDVIDAAAICGGANKVISISTHDDAIDIIGGMLSSGIYTPRSYKVTCKT